MMVGRAVAIDEVVRAAPLDALAPRPKRRAGMDTLTWAFANCGTIVPDIR